MSGLNAPSEERRRRDRDSGDAPGAGVGGRHGLQVVGLLGGAAALVAAFLVPTERVAGGGRTLEGFWLAQCGLAALLAAWGWTRPYRGATLLGSLLLLGTAAQLTLTSPLWLQYLDLRPANLTHGLGALAAAVLAVETLVVVAGTRRHLGRVLRAARALLPLRVLAPSAVAFVFVAAHATPLFREGGTRFAGPYAALLAAALALTALHVATAVLAVAAVPTATLHTWTERARRLAEPGRDVRVVRTVALLFVVAAAVIAVAVNDRVPHLPDGVAYLFQARCLAAGHVTAPAPPVPEAFADYLLDVRNGTWFSTTNPGWPALLALGVLAGVPWLVNPLLGGVSVLLAHAFARRLLDRGPALAATLLLAASPWFLFLAASDMTHVATLTLALAGWLLLTPPDRAQNPLRAALAGLAFGACVVVRPMDGLVLGTLTGVWALARARPRVVSVGAYSLGCVLGALPLALFNATLTGRATQDPMGRYLDVLWYPGANRLGFGADVGNVPNAWGGLDPLPGHGLADVLVNLNQNLCNLHTELFGWAAGSLLLVWAHAALGRFTRRDAAAAALAAAVALGMSLYWFSGGPDYGPRYWFAMLPALVWLTLRGAETLAAVLAARGVGDAAARVALGVALSCALALTTFTPWRAVARYVDYRGFHADYLHLAESGTLGRSLVLVDGDVADTASALALNPPTLATDGPLFARDLGPEVEAQLRAAFPDRPVVHVLGRSKSGGAPCIRRASR